MAESLENDAYEAFLQFERQAKTVRQFSPTVVSGLLQTRDYAADLLKHYSHTEERLERRMARQRSILARVKPVSVTSLEFILDESVLIRPVGSGEVMQRQQQYLERMATWEGISIRVIPFSAGTYRGLSQTFCLLETDDTWALFTEGLFEDSLSMGPAATTRALALWRDLEAISVPLV